MTNKVPESIKKAIEVLSGGGIVIYPTDTAFGIGCRIDDCDTIDRLFSIRKRSVDKPVPVLVSDEAMAIPYLSNPSKVVRRLMKAYWPGALTIVANCHTYLVYAPVRGNSSTIGLRLPDHLQLRQIIRKLGVPILGPSANFSGRPTPYRMEDLDPELLSLVDYILPGDCLRGKVSTVVDCSVSPYQVLRHGAIDLPSEVAISKYHWHSTTG